MIQKKCTGCSFCIKDCSQQDIQLVKNIAVASNKDCNDCGHCIAVCPAEAVVSKSYDMGDVKPYLDSSFSLQPENLLNAIKFRRSTRQFINRVVEENKILKIIESGRFTPTATNLQDVSYTVVKESIAELKAITFETLHNMGQYMLKAGGNDLSIQHKKYAMLFSKMYQEHMEDPQQNDKLFHNAPAVVIIKSSDQWEINGGLAASNMELMINALGLGTFYCGFLVKAAEQNSAIGELIGLKEGEKIVACMPVGYPKVNYLRTVPRKEAVVTWK